MTIAHHGAKRRFPHFCSEAEAPKWMDASVCGRRISLVTIPLSAILDMSINIDICTDTAIFESTECGEVIFRYRRGAFCWKMARGAINSQNVVRNLFPHVIWERFDTLNSTILNWTMREHRYPSNCTPDIPWILGSVIRRTKTFPQRGEFHQSSIVSLGLNLRPARSAERNRN